MADELPILLFATPAELEAWLEEQPRRVGGPLAEDRQERLGERERHLRGGARAGALLRLDRQPEARPRREVLPAAVHAAPAARALVADQPRQGRRADRGGPMRPAGLAEVEAARADGRWEAAYEGARTAKVPEDLQRELDANRAAREFFAEPRQRQPLRDRLPAGRREEARDAGAAAAQVRRHAGARREDPRRVAGLRTLGRWTAPCSIAPSPTPASPPTAPPRSGSGSRAGSRSYEEMTNLPADAARAARGGGAALDALGPGRGEVRRRHRQDALPHRRRPPDRGGADALPRRPPLGLRLLAVGLPADLHLLRHRPDEVRPQPQRRRDPRPGAALPPPRGDRPRRLHGDGRADDEHRRRARRLRAAARPRRHPPPHGDLHRRLGAGDRPPRRVRAAGQPRPLPARAQRRACARS